MEEYAKWYPSMKETHTILIPDMAPIHFGFLTKILKSLGYKVEVLKNTGIDVINKGLKYVHNDTCYPALLVIGQFIDALDKNNYDLNKIALIMTQTGGGCRASNYISLIRKALVKAGYSQVPVVSLNMSGLENGLKITIPFIRRVLAGIAYGDLLMLLKNQTEPYEIKKGASDELVQKWTDSLNNDFDHKKGYSMKDLQKNLKLIADDFAKVPVNRVPKVKVGIVGEIYVKYSALANNNLEKFLLSQDCEVNVPGILNFALYCVDTRIDDINLYGGSKIKKKVMTVLENYLIKVEKAILDAVRCHKEFTCPSEFMHTKYLRQGIIGEGNKMGEGWLLTAEMIELTETGYENIVCAQPFGCLPNHICGKGMVRKIREKYPNANIVPIDYDPGATKVNQENRIKLMLSVAKEKLEQNS